MVDIVRIATMKERLGEAVDLIDDERYLPMFRNRQINYTELFEFSIGLAKKKDKPARYFASLWGAKSLAKTLEWLQKLVNLAKSKAAEVFREAKRVVEERRTATALENPMNRQMRRRYEQMVRKLATT